MNDLLSSLTYGEAKAQLQKIVEDLEEGVVDIDRLEETISKAKDLVRFCQNRLRQTEEKLTEGSNVDTQTGS